MVNQFVVGTSRAGSGGRRLAPSLWLDLAAASQCFVWVSVHSEQRRISRSVYTTLALHRQAQTDIYTQRVIMKNIATVVEEGAVQIAWGSDRSRLFLQAANEPTCSSRGNGSWKIINRFNFLIKAFSVSESCYWFFFHYMYCLFYRALLLLFLV